MTPELKLHCIHCGFDNPAGMRFCGNCGVRLAAESEPAPAITQGTPYAPERLGVLMGADLLERFQRAGLEAGGQRRSVTILFADLAGYTEISKKLEAEDLYCLMEEFIQLLVNEVYKYEGTVDKLTGDGLMALFGAPIAHENNAERAVRAALDMQAGLKRISRRVWEKHGIELHMRIGLNAGAVIVGGIGSDMLMNYTAIGDTVNLAHRFEEAAEPGTILVSESVYQQTRALFEFLPVSDLSLKGLAQPTRGFRILGPKPNPGAVRGLDELRAPMIGRDEELQKLEQIVRDLIRQKQGRLAIITGEAGLGKSRLISELKTSLNPGALRVLEGYSLTYRRSVSYWIFLDLLRRYIGVSSDATEAEVSDKLIQAVQRSLGPRAAEALPYLEHLLSLRPSDASAAARIAYLDASQLRQQIFLAVRDLLVAEARRQPVLLILEDLHWADEASLDLLHFLLDSIRQAPLAILAVSRPFQNGTMVKIAEWAGKHLADRFVSIRLQSLSQDQSEHLLSQLLTGPDLPEAFREQVLERAAGVPFYMEELLRMLIDNGVLLREEGRWRIQPGVDISSLGVPDTLQGLILTRFDRLEELSRRTLQIASVIGHHFNFSLLHRLLPQASPPQLQEALKRLVERDFLLHLGQGTRSEGYIFRHVLMSEAIYKTLLRRERRRLHGEVGQAIEELYANRIDEQIELLARHYSWSPRLDRALHYLILAGQKAARSYVTEQARQNFEQALALFDQVEPTPLQKFQVHVGLGDVLVLMGEYQTAREHYQQAESAVLQGDPDLILKNRSALLRKISTTYERQGDYNKALQYLAEARQMLKTELQTLPVENAKVINEIGWINFRRGNLDLAEQYLFEALALVENRSQYDLTASIYNRLGGIYYQKGQLDQASGFTRKSLVLREEIGDIVAVARSYNNLGLLGWKRGNWDSALANFMRSVELHANLGDVEGVMLLQSNLGLLHIDRGDPKEAQDHLEASLAAAQQIGHTYVIGITYLHFSHLWLSLEKWQTALDYSQRSLEILQEIGDPDNLIDVYINMGLAWLGLGDLDLAEKWGREAIALFEKTPSGPVPQQADNRGRALRLLGNTARLKGQLDQSARLLKESAAVFQASGNQLEQGRSSVALAELASNRGDYASVRILLNEARLIFAQLGAKLDLSKLEKISSRLMALLPNR